MLALLGKTGCGKSTIFNMIAGLTEPTSGTVRVSGRDPFARIRLRFAARWRSCSRTTGCCHGAPRSRTSNSGWKCWTLPRRNGGPRAQLWLTKLGLGGHENDYPHALSGGMRQRVSIARAFATNANILLCDEPFSALDESTAGRLRAEFVRLVKENGKTAVFITHSISEALEIGDRIVVLKRPGEDRL